jgi:hypothetical protein
VVQIIGGVFEELGAAALAITPEPTMATKVGAGILGVHGVDDLYTGWQTLWTGDVHRTITYQTTFAIASSVASDTTANWIATGTDIAAGAGPSLAAGISRRMAISTLEEGGSSVSLAYLHRSMTEAGHTAVGINTGGTTTWFDLAGDINVAGGVEFGTRGVPNAGYWVTTIGVDSASAERALLTAQQMSNELTPSTWTLLGNNCSTTASNVLTQAGIATGPLWSRTPMLLHIGVNYGFLISAGVSTTTGLGANFIGNSPPPIEGIRGRSGL